MEFPEGRLLKITDNLFPALRRDIERARRENKIFVHEVPSKMFVFWQCAIDFYPTSFDGKDLVTYLDLIAQQSQSRVFVKYKLKEKDISDYLATSIYGNFRKNEKNTINKLLLNVDCAQLTPSRLAYHAYLKRTRKHFGLALTPSEIIDAIDRDESFKGNDPDINELRRHIIEFLKSSVSKQKEESYSIPPSLKSNIFHEHPELFKMTNDEEVISNNNTFIAPTTLPKRIDKKEFLRPMVEWIKKQRKNQYFVERRLCELQNSFNQFISTPGNLATSFINENSVEWVQYHKTYVTNRIKDKSAISANDNKLTTETIINTNESFVILGESGSGKTHLLYDIVLDLYEEKENTLIPIYVSLDGYAPQNETSLKKRIQAQIRTRHKYSITNDQLTDERIIFLLDHLDMAQSINQTRVTNDVIQIFSDELFGKHRYIIVSRINLYTQQLEPLNILIIEDLSPKDIETILKESNQPILWDILKCNEQWMDFVKKPLLLKMLIKAYQENKEKDLEISLNKKTNLYRAFLKDFSDNEWVRLKRSGKISYDEVLKLDALSALAFRMHEEGIWSKRCSEAKQMMKSEIMNSAKNNNIILRNNDPGPIVRQIEEENLLITYDSKVFQFLHHSFQEYFSARYLYKNNTTCDNILGKIKADFAWNQVIVFYSGMLKDSSKIVERLLEKEDIKWVHLAGQCAAESDYLQQNIKEFIIRKLVDEFAKNLRMPFPPGFARSCEDLVGFAVQIDNDLLEQLAPLGLVEWEFSRVLALAYCKNPQVGVKRVIDFLNDPDPFVRHRFAVYLDLVFTPHRTRLFKKLADVISEKYFGTIGKQDTPTLHNPPQSNERKLIKKIEDSFLSLLTEIKNEHWEFVLSAIPEIDYDRIYSDSD